MLLDIGDQRDSMAHKDIGVVLDIQVVLAGQVVAVMLALLVVKVISDTTVVLVILVR